MNYDSLQINGKDGFVISQEQGSNELTISKGSTKITLGDGEINIVSDETINLNAANVNIANEPTVKGQTLFNWLNTHVHGDPVSGSTTPPTQQLDQSVLVKEQ
jgi:hypothetical protein